MTIPIEILSDEIFRFFDESTRFSFSWVCKYFAKPSRNTGVSFPFFEVCVNACENGYLDYLKFWYQGDKRPVSVELSNVAAFHGQLAVLQWLSESPMFQLFDHAPLIHSTFCSSKATFDFLCSKGKQLTPQVKELSESDGSLKAVAQILYGVVDRTLSDLEKIQTNLYYSIIKELIEGGVLFLTKEVIVAMAQLGLWRTVKMVCSLQVKPFGTVEPPLDLNPDWEGGGSHYWFGLRYVLSELIMATNRFDLVEWFLDREIFYPFRAICETVSAQKNWRLCYRLFHAKVPDNFIKRPSMFDAILKDGDASVLRWFKEKRLPLTGGISEWIITQTLNKEGKRALLEEIVTTHSFTSEEWNQICFGLLSCGYLDLLKRFVPSKLQNMKLYYSGLEENPPGFWECIMYCLSEKVLDGSELLRVGVLSRNVPLPVFTEILSQRYIGWDEHLAKLFAKVNRWDLLVKAAELGHTFPQDFFMNALKHSKAFPFIKHCIESKAFVWNPELTLLIPGKDSSFDDLVLFGLRSCPHSPSEIATIAKDAIYDCRIELLKNLISEFKFDLQSIEWTDEKRIEVIHTTSLDLLHFLIESNAFPYTDEEIYTLAKKRAHLPLLKLWKGSLPSEFTSKDIAKYIKKLHFDAALHAIDRIPDKVKLLPEMIPNLASIIYSLKAKKDNEAKMERMNSFKKTLIEMFGLRRDGVGKVAYSFGDPNVSGSFPVPEIHLVALIGEAHFAVTSIDRVLPKVVEVPKPSTAIFSFPSLNPSLTASQSSSIPNSNPFMISSAISSTSLPASVSRTPPIPPTPPTFSFPELSSSAMGFVEPSTSSFSFPSFQHLNSSSPTTPSFSFTAPISSTSSTPIFSFAPVVERKRVEDDSDEEFDENAERLRRQKKQFVFPSFNSL